MAMSAGYIPFHPNPSKPKYKPPAGRGRCPLPRVRTGEQISLRAGAQIHALRRAQGKAVRAARFSWLRQECDRAGVLPQQGQSGDGRRARELQRQGEGVAFVGEEVTDGELKAMDRAGVRGVRFNFVRRLVDFTPREVLERIAARIAPLGWHIVVYFEMPDLPELESFFTSLPTTVVVDHMGTPGREEGRRPPREPALPPADGPSTGISGSRSPARNA